VVLDSRVPSKGSQKVTEARHLHHMIEGVDIFYLALRDDLNASED
jgi:hypothetical protein